MARQPLNEKLIETQAMEFEKNKYKKVANTTSKARNIEILRNI